MASLLFEGAKFLFVWYLENPAVFSQVHGSLASVVVLLLWVYLSALILILGAQVSFQYELLYRPGERGGTGGRGVRATADSTIAFAAGD